VTIKDYSFETVEEGNSDIVKLRDEAGKVHVFSMSHHKLVRYSQDLSAFVLQATNRLDFLREEGREN